MTQRSAQLPPVVSIKPQALSNGEIFVSLTELTDLTTCENLVLCGLEIRFNNQSSIVDKAVLMDDIENLSIDVNEARCDEKAGGRIEFFPLLLLQNFYFFLRRNLLF